MILTLVIKNSFVAPNGTPLKDKPQPMTPGSNLRMLIARVKDSCINYTYMIDSYMIPINTNEESNNAIA